MLRRRAPKACHACRSRKIKCDVSNSGIPCRNCSHAKADCSVSQVRKRRTTLHADRPSLPPASIHTFEVSINASHKHGGICDERTIGQSTADATGRLAAEHHDYLQSPPQTVASPTILSPFYQENEPDSQLPKFIVPLRQGLDPEVLHFLRRKQALSLPQQTVRDELLRAYICYVHPFLPLLDLEEFLQAIGGRDGSKKISLILFQAVMFAGSSFVDIRHLEAEGFTYRKGYRKAYYEKVRVRLGVPSEYHGMIHRIAANSQGFQLLFDADVEPDPITLIQVLVLKTYWFDKLEDIKSRFHWMRIAWSFASDRGLSCRSVLVQLPAQEQKLRRRLWWCCLMRDQLLSLSERRPSCILTDETDFPPLLAEDFESSAFSEALEKYSNLDDSRRSSLLSALCIKKIKLCILIRHILLTQYELNAHRRVTSTEPTMLLVPKLSSSTSAEYMARDQELRTWSADFVSTMQNLEHEDLQRNCSIVIVHCSLLEILYHTAIGMAHRPQLLIHHPEDSAARTLLDFSKKNLRGAAQKITEVAKSLEDADLLRFQPPIVVSALLGSAMQHMKDIVSSDLSFRSTAQRHLNETMHTLFRLQEIWFSADNVVNFLETLRGRKTMETVAHTGQGATKSPFNDTSSNDAIPQDQTERGGAVPEFELWPRNSQVHSASEPTHQFDTPLGAVSTEDSEIEYNQDIQGEDLDFERFFNFNSVSEVLFSENFGAADFDVGNWTNMFQGRDWGVYHPI